VSGGAFGAPSGPHFRVEIRSAVSGKSTSRAKPGAPEPPGSTFDAGDSPCYHPTVTPQPDTSRTQNGRDSRTTVLLSELRQWIREVGFPVVVAGYVLWQVDVHIRELITTNQHLATEVHDLVTSLTLRDRASK
jgi:hypothetical protein